MKTLAKFTLLAALALGAGCNPIAPQKVTPKYPCPASCNGSVLQTFRSLYVNRDTLEYARAITSDFVFRFLPDPVTDRVDTLDRAGELAFAASLFVRGSADGLQKPAVAVQVSFDTVSSSPDNRVGHAGWIRYTVQTSLSLTLQDGSSHTVQSPATFYFRQEPAGSGTWKLAEWVDQPATGAPRPGGTLPTARTSWSTLRRLYYGAGSPYVGCGQPKSPYYVPACTPYGVISNFQNLYIRRDTAEYDTLLSRDYVFKFVPDLYTNHEDSLVRPEEHNFAEHLFVTGSLDGTLKPASTIHLTVDTVSSAADNRIGHEGWIRYVVNMDLSVTRTDNSYFNINGPAVLYFAQQPPGSGRWKLAEWDDQPTSSLAPGRRPGATEPATVTSWGHLKKEYR